MSLLDTILNTQCGAVVQQLGSQFGLGQDQTTAALSALIPALAAGAHQQTQTSSGMAGLLTALASGQHQKYVNDPSTLSDASAVTDGNGILGHLFGSKDVSRQVATQAAAQSGVGADVLRQMLPVAASLAMGAMAQHTATAAAGGTPGTSSGEAALMGLLNTTLGQASPQGSMVQNVLGLLGGLLRH